MRIVVASLFGAAAVAGVVLLAAGLLAGESAWVNAGAWVFAGMLLAAILLPLFLYVALVGLRLAFYVRKGEKARF